MIAVDTNVLVYAHRGETPFHSAATQLIRQLAEARPPWAIPWPCIHEFLGVVTHPRVFSPPTSLEMAIAQVDKWHKSPSLVILAETPGYWDTFRKIATAGRIAGPVIHDAKVAVLCKAHGVRELWSADRDFSRFPDLTVKNPLIA